MRGALVLALSVMKGSRWRFIHQNKRGGFHVDSDDPIHLMNLSLNPMEAIVFSNLSHLVIPKSIISNVLVYQLLNKLFLDKIYFPRNLPLTLQLQL